MTHRPTIARFSQRSAGMKPSAIREILKVTEMPEIISFAGGLPAPELFPHAAIGACAQRILAEDGAAALQYGTTEGYGPLREWVCRHLAATVGIKAKPEQVLITAGSQQGLDLIGKVLIDPGDVIVTEDPAYLGALQAFRAYQARMAGIESDDQGMKPEALRAHLKQAKGRSRPKLLYLVTNFNNPTGTSTSARRRKELAAVAADFELPVLEDDPYGELRYTEAAPRALAAGAPHAMYLGTASKMLAPGLRVAWLVVPDRAIYERLVVAKQAADLHTSSFSQRIVEAYVRVPGQLEQHLKTLRRAYGERQHAMVAGLPGALPEGSRWTKPTGGLFIWAELPPGYDPVALLPKALDHQVAYVPGNSFWLRKNPPPSIRLNFSNSSVARIEAGLARLQQALS